MFDFQFCCTVWQRVALSQPPKMTDCETSPPAPYRRLAVPPLPASRCIPRIGAGPSRSLDLGPKNSQVGLKRLDKSYFSVTESRFLRIDCSGIARNLSWGGEGGHGQQFLIGGSKIVLKIAENAPFFRENFRVYGGGAGSRPTGYATDRLLWTVQAVSAAAQLPCDGETRDFSKLKWFQHGLGNQDRFWICF